MQDLVAHLYQEHFRSMDPSAYTATAKNYFEILIHGTQVSYFFMFLKRKMSSISFDLYSKDRIE